MSKKMSVLIVDDEVNIRFITHCYLKKGGYSVRETANEEEAKKALTEQEFCLVITDRDIKPNGCGLNILAYVKEFHPGLPVILMTGDDDSKFKELGFDEVVRKPLLSVGAFLETVDRVLRKT